jgi:hypothetical protein
MKHLKPTTNERPILAQESWWCEGIKCLFMPEWWESQGKEYPLNKEE